MTLLMTHKRPTLFNKHGIICQHTAIALLCCLLLIGCSQPDAQAPPSSQPVVDLTPLPSEDIDSTEPTLVEQETATVPSTYTVQPGDTLTWIADRFGISVSDIAALNGITDTNQIRQGQQLLIPAEPLSTPFTIETATAAP